MHHCAGIRFSFYIFKIFHYIVMKGTFTSNYQTIKKQVDNHKKNISIVQRQAHSITYSANSKTL